MHPRGGPTPWTAARGRHVRALLDFVRDARRGASARGGRALLARHVTNYWGGSSSATTHLLDADALPRPAAGGAPRGRHPDLCRARARAGPRDAAARRAQLDALVDVIVAKYAPLPAASLSTPGQAAALRRSAVDGRAGSHASAREAAARPRARRRRGLVLAGGGDPRRPPRPTTRCACWRRSIRSCGTAAVRDALGLGLSLRGLHAGAQAQARYYALPLLWRDRVIGWGNVSVKRRDAAVGLRLRRVAPPRDRVFRRALEEELNRLSVSLGVR